MIYDFYYYLKYGCLGKNDIGGQRLKQYALCATLKTSQDGELLLWGTIFQKV
jgi:hypothetical protein